MYNEAAYINMHTTDIIHIVSTLTEIVTDIVQYHNYRYPDDIRYGGYYCLRRRTSSTPIVTIQICDIPDAEKAEKYHRVAQVKNRALFDNPQCLSTFQVRDPDREIWRGGIRAGEFDNSFSGLTEEEDETAMIFLDLRLGWLTLGQAAKLAKISGNNLVHDFPKAYYKTEIGRILK